MKSGLESPPLTGSRLLEFYKITLDHRQKVISLIMVSGIAVAIPAAVNVYKASIERDTKVLSLQLEAVNKDKETALKDKEHELEELKFRQSSIQSFSATGLQQDIELRLRLADYFSTLSDKNDQPKWEAYRVKLEGKWKSDKEELDHLNNEIDAEESKPQPDVLELRKLYRAKGWLQAEFNPVQLGAPATIRAAVNQPRSSVRELCEEAFDAHADDPSGFVKAVAQRLNIDLSGLSNEIVDKMRQGEGWEVLPDGATAAEKAASGYLVLAGLKGSEQATPDPHGQVAIVVPGPLAQRKYPTAYWGRLRGRGEKGKTLNGAWRTEDLDRVTYAAIRVNTRP